jgi:hypothetical protein
MLPECLYLTFKIRYQSVNMSKIVPNGRQQFSAGWITQDETGLKSTSQNFPFSKQS